MTLFAEEEKVKEEETFEEQVRKELWMYENHIRGNYDYRLNIEPMATPRPRSRVIANKATGKQFVSVYHPAEYTNYKKIIAIFLKDAKHGVKPGDYTRLFATFYFTYPASYPAKTKIDGMPHLKRPDWDNLVKGFQDALGDALVIVNDGRISNASVLKKYTLEPQGYIAFNLLP